MKEKKQKSTKNHGTREIVGLVVTIVAAFVFVCMVLPLGILSEGIGGLMRGFFGLLAYPIMLFAVAIGIMLMRGKSVTLEKKYVFLLSGVIFFAVMIAHLATSRTFLNVGYGEYLKGVYESKNTVGGQLFGLIGYPIASLISEVGAYVAYSLALILCGFAFVDIKFLRGRVTKPKAEKHEPADTFRNYPEGVVERPRYTTKNSELFVSNILPTATPKNPFRMDGGTASTIENASPYSHDDDFGIYKSIFSDLKASEKNETPKNVVKMSAHDVLYGDEEKVFSHYGKVSSDYNGYHASNYNTHQEKNVPIGGYYSSGGTDTRKNDDEIIFNGESAQSQDKNPFSGQADEKPTVKMQATKPQKIVHEPIKYEVIVPKVSSSEDKYAKNPNPIISAEESSRQLIEQHKKQNAMGNNALAGAYFSKQFEKTPQYEKPKLIHDQQKKEQKQDKKPIEYAKPENIQDLFSQQPIQIEDVFPAQFTPDITDKQSAVDSDILSQDYEAIQVDDSSYSAPLDFDFRVPYEDGKDLGEIPDFTGTYKVLPENNFSSRVSEIESNLINMRSKGRKDKSEKNENQIALTDYAAEAAKEQKAVPKKLRVDNYIAPSIDLLQDLTEPLQFSTEDLNQKARLLEETLINFKIPAEVRHITPGPAVTRYEVYVPPGIKLSNISSYTANIAYSLASNASGIRIEAPIPNRSAIGIEIPNERISTVGLKALIESREFQKSSSPLTFALGKDIAGANIVCDLARMPHLLIAGATGSGKSACLNSLITSLIFKSSPEDLRILMIDPKRVEFTSYEGLPHLYIDKIITEPEAAVNMLGWAIEEMEKRYTIFSTYRTRNITDFNSSELVKSGELAKLPYIVIIVDELADLMMHAKREVEDRIRILSAKARAAGLHLVLATQRPSVDVITGTIKANLPSRIAFMVTSYVDSKTILDKGGADKLLGRGDMLYAPAEANDPIRVQGAYITEREVSEVVKFVTQHNKAEFDDEASQKIFQKKLEPVDTGDDTESQEELVDELFIRALELIIENGKASTSYIQRKLSIGYNRAAKIIDQMESRKFISPADGTAARDVYITLDQFKDAFGEVS